jgi:hypothetical protein
MVMKLQQADLLGSEETPIAVAMRSVGAEYVTKVTQADFKGSQAIGLDDYFPQLRSVVTQDHENIDPIAPKRGIRARNVIIGNAVCKSAGVLGLFLCTTSAESASLSGCYERRYHAAHLGAHPDQRVRRVTLAIKPMSGHAPWVANADLEMAIRRQRGLVSVVGTEEGDTLSCSMDSDRGRFRLVASAPG